MLVFYGNSYAEELKIEFGVSIKYEQGATIFPASTFISLRFAGLIIVFGFYSDNQKTSELEDDF